MLRVLTFWNFTTLPRHCGERVELCAWENLCERWSLGNRTNGIHKTGMSFLGYQRLQILDKTVSNNLWEFKPIQLTRQGTRVSTSERRYIIHLCLGKTSCSVVCMLIALSFLLALSLYHLHKPSSANRGRSFGFVLSNLWKLTIEPMHQSEQHGMKKISCTRAGSCFTSLRRHMHTHTTYV